MTAFAKTGDERTGEEPARYIMIGGFLGAGKTTAVGQLARYLTGRGHSVGLITNDQSDGLVDSALLRHDGHAVEEIAGGCFCCRFSSLSDAIGKLTAATRPDVFVAEPVGSCTDLLATVSYPLRRIYGDRFVISPLSIVVDPLRAARILGLLPGRSFSEKVAYVYKKQLEEAQLILINKCDETDEELQQRLHDELARAFPRADVLRCSARDGAGLAPWFERLLDERGAVGATMPLDYQLYAEGEALLGWLNCTVRVASPEPLDANTLLAELAGDMRACLAEADAEIAHLKMTLDSGLGDGQLAAISVVGTDREPDQRETLLDRVDGGDLIVNLRAEADPTALRAILDHALAAAQGRRPGLVQEITHLEFFRPSPPVPEHRDTHTAEVAP